ncbi:MAG: GNAT family N-acetyltransferase [Rhodobacteraceae bacterium]|nr:MAG: GNAT family N-acetyltransferase [Paracoccaceae bacterium]
MNVEVRAYDPKDAAALYAIFIDAIRVGAANHYTRAQRLAWAPEPDMRASWPDQLAALEIWVAQGDGDIAGFMGATPQGYIDLAFVRPRWMGRGVAQAMYERLFEWAVARGLTRLTTHASLLAQPFFARQGWQVDHSETVDRNGEALKRFAMSLTLGTTP